MRPGAVTKAGGMATSRTRSENSRSANSPSESAARTTKVQLVSASTVGANPVRAPSGVRRTPGGSVPPTSE